MIDRQSNTRSRGLQPSWILLSRGLQPAGNSTRCRALRFILLSFVLPRTCAAWAILILAAAGCQGPLKPVFEPPTPPIVWPTEPAQARIRYLGSLKSSADLKAPRKPFQGIADLFVGPKSPQLLYGPRAVVTSGDTARLWIADPGGRCLHLFDLQNRSYKKIDRAGKEQLLSPAGLCAGPNDTIFVCDSEAVAVYQLSDRTGELLRKVLLADEVRRPVAASYKAATAELFLVDVAGHDVKVLDAEGRIVRVLGRRGKQTGEFNFPCAIADDGALLWIADAGNQRVQGLTYDGDPVVTFGGPGDSPGRMALPKGIAVDSAGNIYVVDARFENVQVFDRSGDLLLVLGQEGINPGQFWLPGGIFIDPSDRIWVCDTYNRRVQVFEPIPTTSQGAER